VDELVDMQASLVNMREGDVLAAVRAAKEKAEPIAAIIASLQAGMRVIGDKHEAGEYYLSALIMAARIFSLALAELDLSEAAVGGDKGTFVLGTAKTDIHDIGKNIVASVLRANGFNVIDLGVDVPPELFVAAVREHNARLVGLSCLLTTAFDALAETIKAFETAGLRDQVRIFIGGGPVTTHLAEQLGADGAGVTAQDAVVLAEAAILGGAR
jgi:dimethylamine corrinoid protein